MEIFSPIQIKEVEFKNRIVTAPMASFKLRSHNGVMGDGLLQHYLNYTDKEIGLMILQALFVMPSHDEFPWACAEEHFVPLRKIVKAAHENGTKVFPQLLMNGDEFESKGGVTGLSIKEMEQIRDAFIRSAKMCKEAGFDGIELHGAHELFLNQVASEITNKRTDRYGGSMDNRLRFMQEIIEGIKAFADDNFIVSYRFGATFDLEKDVQMAQKLVGAGLDMFHVSAGITDVRSIAMPEEFAGYNAIVYAGCHIKQNISVPTIVVNDIRTLERGNRLLERGDCDLVAYGRPFLADPSFVIHQKGM